jgi:hypothetical protein
VTETAETRRATRTISLERPLRGTVKPGPELRRLMFEAVFVAGAAIALVGLGVVMVVRAIRA